MASQAEIDLIVNATRTLSRLDDDLRRIVRLAEARAPSVSVDVDVDRGSARQVTSALLGITRGIAGVVSVGAGIGSIPPLLAGVAAAAQTIAPAAAIATSAMTTMALVGGTLKLAFQGVSDAVSAAFDPDGAEEYAEALKKLAPEARSFVEELRGMRKELRDVQQRVQNNFFRGFDDALSRLAKTTAPSLTQALDATSKSLNRMALGAAETATELGRNGTLGQALESATASLQDMERVPGQATLAFGQLAAASGPAMERISRAVARAADDISGRLATAFETGALEESIDQALSAIAQLGRIGGNLLSGLGNIIGGVTSQGQGLFFILEDLSEAFERLTASKEFQTILNELVLTAQALVANVLPLLQEAFVQLAPVIAELGPPVRDFINQIGPELIPIIKELGPILLDLAVIFREQMPLAIELAKTALQVLNLVLKALHVVLAGIIIPIVQAAAIAFRDYGGIVKSVTGDVDTSVSRLAVRFATFQTRVNASVQSVIGKLGEFAGAFGRMTSAALDAVVQTTLIFGRLPGMVVSAVAGLGARLFAVGQDVIMGLVSGMASMLGQVRSIAMEIADTVAGAVTDLLKISSPSRVFIGIGRDTVSGFIEGIRRALPELASTAAQMGHVAVAGGAITSRDSGDFRMPEMRAPSVVVQIGNKVIEDHIKVVTRAERDFRDRRLAQGVRR